MVAHSSDGLTATTAPVNGGAAINNNKAATHANGDSSVPANKTTNTTTNIPKLPSVDDFRRAIPAHCFERSLVTSTRYLIQDFAALGVLYYLLPYFEHFGGFFGYFVWNCLMGVFGFALFVVGHDCLHGSYSDNQVINDIIGHIAFSPIFSPYFPWQKSHKLHHAFTNHIDKDHGHVWVQDKDYEKWPLWKKMFNPIPFSGWLKWFPVYTVFGYCDGSHFWPYSSLFKRDSERIQCVVSALSCLSCAYIALLIAGSYSNWFWYYWVPLSFFGLMLVIVTYLQHTDDVAEVYEADEWSFVRGQTQTIDRYYGFGLDSTMHHITDGHVAHHLFTRIPHYHLIEATDGVKKVLEPYAGGQYGYKYQINYDFFVRFLWYNIKLDYLVHKTKGIMQYRTTLEAAQKSQ